MLVFSLFTFRLVNTLAFKSSPDIESAVTGAIRRQLHTAPQPKFPSNPLTMKLEDPPKSSAKETGRNWLTGVISKMMFVSGETAEPSIDTTGIMEEIVQQQVKEMVGPCVPIPDSDSCP